jgi:hypothetical protein
VAIYWPAGYGLDHCAGNLLENHPDVLQTAATATNHPNITHVAHHRSRDLILRGDMATNSRRTQEIV